MTDCITLLLFAVILNSNLFKFTRLVRKYRRLQVSSGPRVSLNGLYKGSLVFKSGYQPLGKSLELLNSTHTLPVPLEVYPNSGIYLYSTNIAVLYEGTFPGVSKEEGVRI